MDRETGLRVRFGPGRGRRDGGQSAPPAWVPPDVTTLRDLCGAEGPDAAGRTRCEPGYWELGSAGVVLDLEGGLHVLNATAYELWREVVTSGRDEADAIAALAERFQQSPARVAADSAPVITRLRQVATATRPGAAR